MSHHYKISVIGLGKLGSCLAAVLASRNNKVLGVDINKNIIKSINNRKSPYQEKDLTELLEKSGENLQANSDTIRSVSESEVIFIVLPTPSLANGKFSLKYILNVIPDIAKGLKKNPHSFPVIILTSTVMPGDCEKYIIPSLEKHSGLKCGLNFGFCYNPEFIALGSVIKDMQQPDMVLIGSSDEKSGKKLLSVYKTFIENKPAYETMNIVNAEIVKLSINTFVTTKISYANMLTQICNETKDANVDVVTSALGKDSRIGPKYLKGGGSYGGPCFPRDNKAFIKMASEKNINAHLAEATDKINKSHIEFICKKAYKHAGKTGKIGILGISYKPDTPVKEKSSGILIAEKLIKKKYKVSYYDPMVKTSGIDSFNKETSIKKLLKTTDVIIISNNNAEYARITPSMLKENSIILDCWRILEEDTWKDFSGWYPLGIHK